MRYLFVLYIFFLSSNVLAQIWYPVVESEDGATYSYDSSSIKREGDIVAYWELVDYSEPLKSGNLVVSSAKTKVIQDCKNDRFKIADLIDYDGRKGMGNIVNVEMARQTNWYKGTPESINEAMKNIVCNR